MQIPTKQQLAEANIHCFNELYDITNDQGQKLDFYDHPFLWDIFSDFSPIIAIRKAAQVGMSTLSNIKVMWAAKNKQLDVIYSLPAMNDVHDFVGGKTNRLIANNKIFREWTKDQDSIEQKRIGGNVIYFRGTWTDRAALMIPADLYVADEVDRSKQDVVVQFETRLQHSKFGWRWYFSNPSAPGVGVDKYWSQSDEKQWFVECKECGHDWYLTMENIMGIPAYFGCTKCKKELDRRNGRWVKRWETGKAVSGYQISLLMCPWVSAQYILDKKKSYSEEQFCNFVLGTPYVGKGNVLSQPLLFQNLTKRINPQDSRCIIGVDTGVDIRYTIGNKYGLFYYGECKDYSELEKLLTRWSDAIMVIDQGGDIIGPRKLREKYPNRVFLCFYRQDTKTDELITWNDDDGTVRADRNKCIQLVVDEFTEKRIPIYGNDSEWYDYWLHWSHIYRVEEYNDNTGITKYTWMRSDRDDWVQATVYWRIGMSRFMDQFVSFSEPNIKFGSPGYEALADGTAFMPKFNPN